MKLNSLGFTIMALFTCACPPDARADNVDFTLAPAKPTLGSVDCLRAAGITSSACPYEIGALGSAQNAEPDTVGAHRVLRILASEHLHDRFRFLKPFNPLQPSALRGFSTNMVMGYPGATMYLNLQDMSVDWRLFGGASRYFNNDDPYAVMQFAWRW